MVTCSQIAVWQGYELYLLSVSYTHLDVYKRQAYSMSGFIMAENPEMTAKEAMQVSEKMMAGNKWRLFCLQFSFIGWQILCILSLGIGFLWLTPYMNAATAAFYDEISREPLN